MTKTESRQVRRAAARRNRKMVQPKYPLKAQWGGPSEMLIHRNRRHRDDDQDYFPRRS
jgi:hypothetical protein